MRPTGIPMWPTRRSITPRTASVNRVRELEIAEMDVPVDGMSLCEILPFGSLIDGEGIEWVAVRIAVICEAMGTALETSGWAPRFILDSLPALRELVWQAPDDPSSLTDLTPWMMSASTRGPSPKTIKSVRPADGERLLYAWRTGRKPVMTTLAFLLQAMNLTNPRYLDAVQHAYEHLLTRHIGQMEKRSIIQVLEALIPELAGMEEWPDVPDLLGDEG
jgi:hypothetical protein